MTGRRRIISLHSYRGGTGKSTLAANFAWFAAARGDRVAVLDCDLVSPGIHILFGLERDQIQLTLVDFLWGKCGLEETAYDVTERLRPPGDGKCWLIPASLTAQAITRVLEEGYDVQRLNSHFDQLLEYLDLDWLLIDTHPGLNRETLLTTAISDQLILILRPDQQDYYGTAVINELAAKLEIRRIHLILNKVYSQADTAALTTKVTEAFDHPVIGVLPLSEDLARLQSREIIARAQPEHAVSRTIHDMAETIFSS
ncbi:MAG TPA: MinD/ParA family protein [Candidatus Sumerlaeota bacterium]|nr:MAG: Septum site-determining protein MinD [candidate division BRC1 bacterium ADurb.BinA292]HOE95590.1 MinD/ParA family protein [Candidatus Sumerlaeota bacterium]HOR29606.1 MinD/ParA family protein [Candidatus Sumerlaeota bacterium]HPK02922.1 MinD/ParA family protein [Candidatus Sumerlaeota bacterium]